MIEKLEAYTDEELKAKIRELDKLIREQRQIDFAKLPDSERLAIIQQIKGYEKQLEALFQEKHRRNYLKKKLARELQRSDRDAHRSNSF